MRRATVETDPFQVRRHNGDQSARGSGITPVGSSDATGNELPDLLLRMRKGDRDAAATFITRFGSRVRRRVRGKLGPAMRRLFDSQEILSTVGRRLDLYVRNGKLEAADERELWSLIFRMADNAVIDKLRILQRLEQVEAADSEFAHHLLFRLRQADRRELDGAERAIEQALRILTDVQDRQILQLWLSGLDHASIGEELGLTAVATRRRWHEIKEKLREHLAVENE